jgi:hypothetical protein
MPTVTQNLNTSIGGISFPSVISRTGTAVFAAEVSKPLATLAIAPAVAQLTTRTDDDTGVITCQAGHGIISADVIDVYWDGGIRYGMVATVATNAVSVEGGAGDNLPTNLTSVYVCKQTQINVDVDGDDLEVLAVLSNVRGHVVFAKNDDTEISAAELVAGEAYIFTSDTLAANNLTGDPIGYLAVSVGGTNTSAYVRAGGLYNA